METDGTRQLLVQVGGHRFLLLGWCESPVDLLLSDSPLSLFCRHGSFDQRGDIAAASITASGIALASKTTADALEELKSYKEMKNVLLSQTTMDLFIFSASSKLEDYNAMFLHCVLLFKY